MKQKFSHVAKIRTSLGRTAHLFPVPSGQKKRVNEIFLGRDEQGNYGVQLGTKGGNLVTIDCYSDHPFDNIFMGRDEQGNYGVQLGTKGDNIVTIDCYGDPFRDAMLKANPWIAETVRTTDARGCIFWLRLIGSYPTGIHCLKDANGNDLGEWRANGSQTIISGFQSMDRRLLLETPPLGVNYDRIVWPPLCVTRLTTSAPTTTERRRNRETELPSDRATESVFLCGGLYVDVVPLLPAAPHQNHNRLFHLAREVKSDEKRIGRSAIPGELRSVFENWHRLNKFLRAEQTQADYWVEFMNAYENAHTGIGENPVLEAWQRAITEPVPPEILHRLQHEENGLLCRVAALCWQRQKDVGYAVFFLSCRDLGKLMQRDFNTANSYLLRLCSLGVIKVVTKGNKKLAGRYRYVLTKKSGRKS